MPTISELAWAAGFLDGEGHFHYSGGFQVKAAQVELGPLERLQRTLGGKIYGPYKYTVNQRPYWYWCAGRDGVGSAAGTAMTLFSLMCKPKREQIKAALAKWRSKRRGY